MKSFKIYFMIYLALTIYDYYFAIWYIFSLEKIIIFHHTQEKSSNFNKLFFSIISWKSPKGFLSEPWYREEDWNSLSLRVIREIWQQSKLKKIFKTIWMGELFIKKWIAALALMKNACNFPDMFWNNSYP